MSIQVTDISPEALKSVVNDLNTVGFACIPNYVKPEDITRLRSFVADSIEQANGQCVHYKGLDSLRGSGFDELANSPQFTKLLHDVYEQGTGRPLLDQKFYVVLRCLSGETGREHAYQFHYDTFVVTALVPIEIPTEGQPGDLLMYPNKRNIRSNYLFSVVDKLLLHNKLRQKILRAMVDSKWFRPTRLQMKPGNLYIFWGYRSLHANEPCDLDKVRATALFHYANPHADGFALRDKLLPGFRKTGVTVGN